MNREDRRKTAKELRSKMGYTQSVSGLSKIIRQAIESQSEDEIKIVDGDSVMINVKLITGKNNFDAMSEEYKSFVIGNENRIFTAHVEAGGAISFVEEPNWLFIKTELIKVDNDTEAQTGDSS